MSGPNPWRAWTTSIYSVSFPSWSRSERTFETFDPAQDWTRSLCCGPPTQSASAMWSQVEMTQPKTCFVLSRWAHAQDSLGTRLVQRKPCLTASLPSAWPRGVTIHAFCCGQHPGGLRLPQWIPTEHTGAGCPGAGFPAPCVRGRGRFQVRSDEGQVCSGGLPHQLWPQGTWGFMRCQRKAARTVGW